MDRQAQISPSFDEGQADRRATHKAGGGRPVPFYERRLFQCFSQIGKKPLNPAGDCAMTLYFTRPRPDTGIVRK